MPKLPRLTAAEAEKLLLRAGFVWVRSKGGHRIYTERPKSTAPGLGTRPTGGCRPRALTRRYFWRRV
jgi:predicted RNA binding protein YcfA (HicA-like mRNA interferase family)